MSCTRAALPAIETEKLTILLEYNAITNRIKKIEFIFTQNSLDSAEWDGGVGRERENASFNYPMMFL